MTPFPRTYHASQLSPLPRGRGWGLDRGSGREIFVQVRTSGLRIASVAGRPRQATQPPAPGPGSGLDRVSGREIFVQVRTSGLRIASVAGRPRQATQPPAPGPGSGLDRVSGREIFVQVRTSGLRIASEIPSWAPMCGRQPAGGPSSGNPRSGWRSWAKRSVLTRDPGPNPDPRNTVPAAVPPSPDPRAASWPAPGETSSVSGPRPT